MYDFSMSDLKCICASNYRRICLEHVYQIKKLPGYKPGSFLF